MTNEQEISSIKFTLNELAPKLKNNLEHLKYPLIIEFAGSPKSGKTSSVQAIAKYFRRHKITTSIITERASVCPIKDKHHLFFNIWTGCMSLAQMLEALENPTNVIILDRGIFDSLVWIDFLAKWYAVDKNEVPSIQNFFLLERWAKKIDIVTALTVSPEESLRREFKDQITDVEGSIMNTENLKLYNESLSSCLERFKSNFRQIIKIDTTDAIQVNNVAQIAMNVISSVDELSDEEIAVVDRDLVVNNFVHDGIIKQEKDINDFIHKILQNIKWVRRTDAESNISLIQIISVAVFTRGDEILLLKIRGEKQGRLANRESIWAGGHICKSDIKGPIASEVLLRNTLLRELDEELKFKVIESELSKKISAIIWDTSEPGSNQHLGIFFNYTIPLSKPKDVLHMREFWETNNKSLYTYFKPINSDWNNIIDLETWSKIFLQTKYDINITKKTTQSRIF